MMMMMTMMMMRMMIMMMMMMVKKLMRMMTLTTMMMRTTLKIATILHQFKSPYQALGQGFVDSHPSKFSLQISQRVFENVLYFSSLGSVVGRWQSEPANGPTSPDAA